MLSMKNCMLGLLVLALTLMSQEETFAQSSKFFGEIYVPNNSSISIFNKHTFHNGDNGIYPGVVATERENQKGYINFIYGSSWVGASDMQHVDGYVKVYHNESFTFPVGANSKFRPIAISGAARTSAAYFDNNPSFIEKSGTSKVEPLIHQISEMEYWDVDGDNTTKVTLTWDARSSVKSLTESDLNRLTIVGWTGNQWEVIPSSIDRFTLDISDSDAKMGSHIADFSRGSISTNDLIKPNNYDYITLASLNPNTMARVQPQFDVFPNPQVIRKEVSINYQFSSNQGGFVRLYSPTNALLAEQEIADERGVVRLSNASVDKAGVYVIGIIDRNGNATYDKLVLIEE